MDLAGAATLKIAITPDIGRGAGADLTYGSRDELPRRSEKANARSKSPTI
jgi:hypothetical protein